MVKKKRKSRLMKELEDYNKWPDNNDQSSQEESKDNNTNTRFNMRKVIQLYDDVAVPMLREELKKKKTSCTASASTISLSTAVPSAGDVVVVQCGRSPASASASASQAKYMGDIAEKTSTTPSSGDEGVNFGFRRPLSSASKSASVSAVAKSSTVAKFKKQKSTISQQQNIPCYEEEDLVRTVVFNTHKLHIHLFSRSSTDNVIVHAVNNDAYKNLIFLDDIVISAGDIPLKNKSIKHVRLLISTLKRPLTLKVIRPSQHKQQEKQHQQQQQQQQQRESTVSVQSSSDYKQQQQEQDQQQQQVEKQPRVVPYDCKIRSLRDILNTLSPVILSDSVQSDNNNDGDSVYKEREEETLNARIQNVAHTPGLGTTTATITEAATLAEDRARGRIHGPDYVPCGRRPLNAAAICPTCHVIHGPNVLRRTTNTISCGICRINEVTGYDVPCGHVYCLICLENVGFRWDGIGCYNI